MTSLDLGALVLFIATGVAAGLVGCFALMRRMTLAADALSHVALPGIGLAIVLRIHPLLGGVAMLLLGGLLVWGLERRTHIATETVIGVVFSTALAAGSLLTSNEQLIEALFAVRGGRRASRCRWDSPSRRPSSHSCFASVTDSCWRSSRRTSRVPRASTSRGSTCASCSSSG